MSWFAKKKPLRPPGRAVLVKSFETVSRESTSSVSSSEGKFLESDVEGVVNPLAWESMPPALREQFPHWQHSSPVLKQAAPGKPGSPCEQVFHQFSNSTLKQPQNTIPYVVMDCDTLNSISVKFDTTPGEIARLNRKMVAGTVFSGEVLYVPDQDVIIAPSSPPPPTSDDGDVTKESQDAQKPPPSAASPKGPSSPTAVLDAEVSSRESISFDWQTGTMEEVAETHVTVVAKFISNDQGCVHGSLMVTKMAIMFQPHPHDPLVREHGCHGEFEVLLPLQDIMTACVSKDCSCKMEKKRKSGPLGEAPPTFSDEHADGLHAESADNDGHEATSVAKETSNPSSGDDHMTCDVEDTSESSVVKEMSDESTETSCVIEASESSIATLTNSIADSAANMQQNQSRQNDNANEEGTGTEPTDMESGPPVLTNDAQHESTAENHTSLVDNDIVANTEKPKTQQGAEFPLSAPPAGNHANSSQDEEDGLLDIMSAAITPTTSRPGHSNSTASEGSTASLFVEHPNFLHIRVSPQPGSAYTYVPLSNVGISIPGNENSSKTGKKRRSRSPSNSAVVQHVKAFFCFAIPERRVDDLVAFMCQHHPQARSGSSESDKGGCSVFITCSQGMDAGDLKFHDDHFMDPDASSWEIFSLKDISVYRKIIPRMEVEASLPLPNMSDPSQLLREDHIRKLCSQLPYQAVGHDWVLIYSTLKNGISLRTLYRNMANYEATPTLLVVRDENKKVFGAVVSCRLLISDHFYGTGESLLYSFSDSADITVYPWTGANNYIVKGNSDSIGFGSGDGHFGLWLDEYFHHGSSYRCSTFGNSCLATSEDFICEAIEAWGFSGVNEY